MHGQQNINISDRTAIRDTLYAKIKSIRPVC